MYLNYKVTPISNLPHCQNPVIYAAGGFGRAGSESDLFDAEKRTYFTDLEGALSQNQLGVDDFKNKMQVKFFIQLAYEVDSKRFGGTCEYSLEWTYQLELGTDEDGETSYTDPQSIGKVTIRDLKKDVANLIPANTVAQMIIERQNYTDAAIDMSQEK